MNSSKRLPVFLGISTGLTLGLMGLFVWMLAGGQLPGRDEGRQARLDVADVHHSVDAQRSNAIVLATERVSPAVVSVVSLARRTLSRRQQWFEAMVLRQAPERPDRLEPINLGSGFIVDAKGFVLTNYHVIAQAQEIYVTLQNGKNYKAELVGESPRYDMAVLKIVGDVSGLPVAPLGRSDESRIGEWAIAIGLPYGYILGDTSPTVTVGVVSAVHRDIKPDRSNAFHYFDMMQTDAAIHPGNSGGPLVNADGEVIGINTFLLGGQGGSGLGFAIPIDRGRWVVEEIFKYGRFRDAYYGIRGHFVAEYQQQGIRMRDDTPQGYLVEGLLDGSPGETAGIRPGDVIVSIDGEDTVNQVALSRALYYAGVGRELSMRAWRAGKYFQTQIVGIEMPAAEGDSR